MDRFRLGIATADPSNGVSLMRAWGPLSALSRENPWLELVPPVMSPEGNWLLHWPWLARLDAVLLVAPHAPVHAQCAVAAKMMGLPVWVDWDDDLTCVPPWNPRQQLFPPAQTKRVLETLTRLADVVTVSTEEIRKRRSQSGLTSAATDKLMVLPNGCQWPFSELPRARRVTWRGWGNHDADLEDVLPQIVEVSKLPQFGGWKWTFIGEVPWRLREACPESTEERETPYEYDNGADAHLYMKMLAELRPYLHLAPLRDHPFNRCRSNLAWLEATAAGAAVIGPNFQEWQVPGVINYKTPEEFGKLVRHQLEMALPRRDPRAVELEMHPCVNVSRNHIAENLRLKELNAVRLEIIRGFQQKVLPHGHQVTKPEFSQEITERTEVET